MTKQAHDKIAEGLQDALAVARGDDLVKRLRRDAQAARDYLGPPEIAPSISLDDAEDAADRIEALEAEVARLKAERNAALADCGHWRKDYTELQRLFLATDELLKARTIERDAAMAWFRAVEKTGSALCQTFDLATPAEEALRDVLTTACSLAEFEAFRAGAEGMRESAAMACEDQIAKFLDPQYAFPQPIGSIQERFACGECANAIRALPIGDAT